MLSDVIVSSNWLAANISSVVVCDVRSYLDSRVGRDAYSAGHISGAIFVDLDTDLSTIDPSQPRLGRHPFPTPEAFANSMAALGISDTNALVAYDDTGGAMASRLVWMWRILGRQAALLDGGIQAWSEPLTTDSTVRSPGECRVQNWPTERFVDIDTAAEMASHGQWLDARLPSRFRGDPNPIDARLGHMPGARNAPWQSNLAADSMTFLSPAELRTRYVALGVQVGEPVGVSCGSGVTACHDLLALERAGFGQGQLFAASWSGWVADPVRPVQTGDHTIS